MEYSWDPNKNRKNIKLHGIDFIDAIEMFQYPLLVCIDKREDYGEERWVGIGFLKGIIAVIVYFYNVRITFPVVERSRDDAFYANHACHFDSAQ